MYAAVTTRPDMAFGVTRLSYFLTNPGSMPRYGDMVLLLEGIRHLGLKLGGGDNFVIASDASYTDNMID